MITVHIEDVPLNGSFYEFQVGTAGPVVMDQSEPTDASRIVGTTHAS